jgi:hypothetical protein
MPPSVGVDALLNFVIGVVSSIRLKGLRPVRISTRLRRKCTNTMKAAPTASTHAIVWPVTKQGKNRDSAKKSGLNTPPNHIFLYKYRNKFES